MLGEPRLRRTAAGWRDVGYGKGPAGHRRLDGSRWRVAVQELADEAFRDLLRKHQRPVTLKDALRQSARRLPANDDATPAGKAKVKGK